MNFKILNNIPAFRESYCFDYHNPNNFLLVGNEIRIVDDIDLVKTPNPNNLTALLTPFLHSLNAYKTAKYEESFAKDRGIIFEKSILAHEKAELFINPFDKRGMGILDSTLSLTELKTTGTELIKTLEEFRSKIPNVETRLEHVKNYLESIH